MKHIIFIIQVQSSTHQGEKTFFNND